ncbi:hypothetical protein Hdeb2414_s0007g00259901 [Helianthus debilis subsp. tardiflorus]
MAPKPETTAKDPTTVSKRKRSETISSSTQPLADDTLAVKPPQELVPREFKRLSLTINPEFVRKLCAEGIIGYARLDSQRLPTMRYYTINVATFRETISHLLTSYISRKLYEWTFDETDNLLTTIIPAITDACMSALYAKLHSIHTKFRTYADRYATAPTYTQDIKLPIPFADAIQNFGPFTPSGTVIHYLCIPTYPENIANEGRCSENLSSSQLDQSYLPYLKQIGIPVMSVDTRADLGSPWWSYKVKYIYGQYDLRCIYPPSNYADHSAMVAALFARANDEGEALPIVQHLADDKDYAFRLREAPDGIFQQKMFAALCNAPSVEWT